MIKNGTTLGIFEKKEELEQAKQNKVQLSPYRPILLTIYSQKNHSIDFK